MDLRTEVQQIRQEYEDIKRHVGLLIEVSEIREEYESIKRAVDNLVAQQGKGKEKEVPKAVPKREAAKPAPIKKTEAPAPKPVEKKVEPKPAPAPVVTKPAAPKPVEKKVEPKPAPKPVVVTKPSAPKPVEKKVEPPSQNRLQATTQSSRKNSWTPPEGPMAVILSNPTEFGNAMDDLHDGQLSWLLVGYVDNRDKVGLQQKGTGDVSQLVGFLKDDSPAYALLRVDVESTTTKFIFITWIGEQTRAMRKARVSTHRGGIARLFGVSF